jgi:hypothetical protein
MANENKEQRKQNRTDKRLRKDDKRMGILAAMDVNRASLKNTPIKDNTAQEEKKPGKIRIESKGNVTDVIAEDQPNPTAAKDAVNSQLSVLSGQSNIPKGAVHSYGNDATGSVRNAISAVINKGPVQNPSAVNTPTSGVTLVDAVSKGGGDINDLNAAVSDAKIADKNEIEIKNQLAAETDTALNFIDESIPSMPTAQLETTEPIPGDGRTLVSQEFMQTKPGERPTLTNAMTKEDLYSKILEKNKGLYDQASSIALEQLGVEDYYPNIRKDIAVGTYSGKYLGSATIFSAPGARLPLGLYDARKRALRDAAQAKQKKIDEILSVPETSPQYQALFSESFYGMLESDLERLGYDFDAFSRDPQALRNMAKYEAKAKEITASVSFADGMLTAGAEDATYVPDEILKLSMDVKYAQINNLDAILAGEANAVAPFKKAQVYKDLVPEVQKLAKDLLDPARMSQSPINLKTGGKFDSESWTKERDAFFVKVKSGIGWEEYATGINKYFDGDYKGMIENLVVGRGGSEDQIEPMQNMFAAMIQNQTVLDYENVKNDQVARENLNERKRQFDLTREDRNSNFWGNINGAFSDAVDPKTGRTYNQELAEAEKITDPKKRAERLKQITEEYNVGSQTYVDTKNGSFISFVAPSTQAAALDAEPKPLKSGDKDIRFVDVEYWENGKWNRMSLSPSRIAASKKAIRPYGSEKALTQEEKTSYESVQGAVYTKTIGYEIQKAYTDANGKVIYLKADGSNLAQYNASKDKKTLTVTVEKPYVREQITDKINGTTYVDKELPGTMKVLPVDITNKVDQQILNNQSGYTPKAAAEETFDDGSTFNYSGSSSN